MMDPVFSALDCHCDSKPKSNKPLSHFMLMKYFRLSIKEFYKVMILYQKLVSPTILLSQIYGFVPSSAYTKIFTIERVIHPVFKLPEITITKCGVHQYCFTNNNIWKFWFSITKYPLQKTSWIRDSPLSEHSSESIFQIVHQLESWFFHNFFYRWISVV